MDVREPAEELRAEPDATPPAFDDLASPAELVSGDRTRDDFLDVVLTLREPATVSEVAERAGHGVDAAREYLAWFEGMGIVRQRSETPATYERNESYFEWRKVDRLQEAHTTDELLELLDEDTRAAANYAEQFDAESPAAVSVSAYAAETGRSVEAVWEALSAWRTVRRRIDLVERALEGGDGDAAERERVV